MFVISTETLSAAAIRNPVETWQHDQQAAESATNDYRREEPRKAFEIEQVAGLCPKASRDHDSGRG